MCGNHILKHPRGSRKIIKRPLEMNGPFFYESWDQLGNACLKLSSRQKYGQVGWSAVFLLEDAKARITRFGAMNPTQCIVTSSERAAGRQPRSRSRAGLRQSARRFASYLAGADDERRQRKKDRSLLAIRKEVSGSQEAAKEKQDFIPQFLDTVLENNQQKA